MLLGDCCRSYHRSILIKESGETDNKRQETHDISITDTEEERIEQRHRHITGNKKDRTTEQIEKH